MSSPPAQIPCETTVMDALQLCTSHRYSGVAVMKDQQLLGNFSISDLKCLTEDNWKHLLSLSVLNFMEETKKFAKLPIVCEKHASLEDVMRRMNNEHVHRVYLTNGGGSQVPVGVVSISDVVAFLSQKLRPLVTTSPSAT